MDSPSWKSSPLIRQSLAKVIDSYKSSILNFIFGCERNAPKQADGVDRLFGSQIDEDPLRETGIRLAGKLFVEIGVTFPKAVDVAIIETRISIVVCLI